MNRNDQYNRNRQPHQGWDQQSYNRLEEERGYHRGHSHYRNEGDSGSQNSVRGYGNYGNMGSYGGSQGYGESNARRQGYYGRPYGDERYQQQNQRPDPERNWHRDETPYGDWRENAGYYRQRQPQGQQGAYYGGQDQNRREYQQDFDRDDFPRRGRSYGPGNTAGGAYMGSGYSRISEGEYGPMLGVEGSESAFSRMNGGYSSRGGFSNPGNSFNTIRHSMWDEDIDNDYGASFGDDIEYNPYEAPGRRRQHSGRSQSGRRQGDRRR